MYRHPDLEKIKSCPYKCLKCPPEGHPDPNEKLPDAELSWTISSGESDGEAGKEPIRIMGTGKHNKKNRKDNWQYKKREPDMDPDAEEFEYLGGFANKAFREEPPEQGSSKKSKEKEEVQYQQIPNTDDFSQPIINWVKPEFLEGLKAKNFI
ncbi:hypothetical protein ACQ4LE_002810 [Meloidogyne hapla]|uniref:Uncharacterized protein n=1 Tax=Meloidogyne hapla TaxID=6305 RepID=A0A1I8C114_MELHA